MGQQGESKRIERKFEVEEYSDSSKKTSRISSGKIYAGAFPVLFSKGELMCWGVKNNFMGQTYFKGVGSTATPDDQSGSQFERKLAHLMQIAGFNHSERSVLMAVFNFQLGENVPERRIPFCAMVRGFMEKTGTYPIQSLSPFKGDGGVFNPSRPSKPDQYFYGVLNVVIPHGNDTKVGDVTELRLLTQGSDLQRENFDPKQSDSDWRGIWVEKSLDNIQKDMTPSHIAPFKRVLLSMKVHFTNLRDDASTTSHYQYCDTCIKALQKLLS